MWKSFFGKKPSDEKIDRLVEQKNSREYKVYPVLKNGAWPGLQAGALRQVLVGSEEDPQVVIGFGYDTPENVLFLTQLDLKDLDPNQILVDAYKNLGEYETSFEYASRFDKKLLVSSGMEFSSERILVKEHMMKAHEMLDAEEILVTIPRRRCMLVMDRQAEPELINAFVAMHRNAWQDDSYGNAPIANMLFVLKAGQMIGTIPMED
ncbi:MAG: hypothetical protein AAFP77_08980 [Bacteroidota bacterium]